MDDSVFDKIFSVAAAAWTAVALLAVRLFHTWPLVMDRLNERKRDAATEKAGDWERIRAERDSLHARLAERDKLIADLRAENAELLGRAVIAEAQLIGRDKADSRATILPGVGKPTNGNGGGK